MIIAITGTTGFVGSALLPTLSQHHQTRPITRAEFGGLLLATNYSTVFTHADVVIHLAARAHILNDTATDPLAAFRETNTAGTLNLARQVADAGVRRFIFISSIGVNGNQTFGKPFTSADTPNPAEPYAISKHEAEIGLRQIAAETGMEVVIIRPPLVYGANAPGNFGRLIQTIARGIPLPLAASTTTAASSLYSTSPTSSPPASTTPLPPTKRSSSVTAKTSPPPTSSTV